MTIYYSKQRQSNPEVFERENCDPPLYGVRDGDIILIPPEYHGIEKYEYGYIGRKGAYYYAFSEKGEAFIKRAAGIEAFGKKGVLVYKDGKRENPELFSWKTET